MIENTHTLPGIDRDPGFRETGATSEYRTYHGSSSALLFCGCPCIIVWLSLSDLYEITAGEEMSVWTDNACSSSDDGACPSPSLVVLLLCTLPDALISNFFGATI